MTERKPEGVSWQSWTERLIQAAQQDGAFDDLDGHGRPIEGLDAAHDEMWWVKAKLRDEEITVLPPTIAIRAEREDAIAAALRATTEAEARRHVADVNDRIRYINSHAAPGPPSSVVTIDPEVIVARWRAHAPQVDVKPEQAATNRGPGTHRRRRWWSRSWWSRSWWRSRRD